MPAGRISAERFGRDLAGLLGVPPGQALLHITRIGFDADDRAVELTQSYCRSDVYTFVTEMRREPG